MSRPRLLVFAYACEPGSGSEPGAGWGVTRSLARWADVTVLVSGEHAGGLAAWRTEHPDDPMQEVVVRDRWSVPAARHRILRFLAYLGWLRVARRVGADLHRRQPFDAVVHVTYAVYWLPTPAGDLGPPAVLGPVGGAVRPARGLWTQLGARGAVVAAVDVMAVAALARLPATRRSFRRADAVVAQNPETARAVGGATAVVNHALFTDAGGALWQGPETADVVLVGVDPRKGGRLALRALRRMPAPVRLVVVGDGPGRVSLERLAARLGVGDRVEFTGQVPREMVAARLRRAAVALFVGLYEEGGLALAEALAVGVPTVVLDHGGAGTVARCALDETRVARVAPGSVGETAARLAASLTAFVEQPPTTRGPNLDRVSAAERLEAVVRAAAGAGTPPRPAQQVRPDPPPTG